MSKNLFEVNKSFVLKHYMDHMEDNDVLYMDVMCIEKDRIVKFIITRVAENKNKLVICCDHFNPENGLTSKCMYAWDKQVKSSQ